MTGQFSAQPVPVRVGEIVIRDGRYYADLLPGSAGVAEPLRCGTHPSACKRSLFEARGVLHAGGVAAGERDRNCMCVGSRQRARRPIPRMRQPAMRVRPLPACTRPAFDVNVSGAQIDAEVRRRLKAAEPLYHVDTDLIRELKPDLLHHASPSQVCAVTPGDVERAGCGRISLAGAGPVCRERPGHLRGDDSVGRGRCPRPKAGTEANRDMRRRMKPSAKQSAPANAIGGDAGMDDPIFPMGNWSRN